MKSLMFAVCLATLTAGAADAMRTPTVGDSRLEGHVAAKLDAFVRERMTSPFAQTEIFGEARRAFERRDDDIKGHGGLWRGEFWGKLMLSTARVAAYRRDKALTEFVRQECHRLMALQDADGYLGSYADPDLVSITDPEATRKIYGWYPCWNLWNRKYAIWGMLAAYQATKDESILASVERQMDHWIAQLHRLNLRLYQTGTSTMNGMPSMSVLKPLLQLYAVTRKPAYLAYAREMLPDWDRADGKAPNFYRNATNGVPLHMWYPQPWRWAKAYEMMSCLDGLVEYHRVTGDRRALDTVRAIRDNIATSEANPFGGVGFGDHLVGAAKRVNALSEVCDAIHWIRLNADLFLVTGEDRYADAMETAYFNNFLPGVYRRGDYGAFFLRGVGRHECQKQCGFAYNHCCVNNMARTWMDMAETVVTRDAQGVFHVNFFADATVTLDGCTFEIRGDYPVGNVVRVRVSDAKAKVAFRHPAWCDKLDVAQEDGVYTLTFDMPARLVDRKCASDPATDSVGNWMRNRYPDGNVQAGRDVMEFFRTEPALTLWRGPLLLAKAVRVGDTRAEMLEVPSVIGRGATVKLTPIEKRGVWGAWEAEIALPDGSSQRVKVCDFESASDHPFGSGANAFSIWF